jgi:hypothetical protein
MASIDMLDNALVSCFWVMNAKLKLFTFQTAMSAVTTTTSAQRCPHVLTHQALSNVLAQKDWK